MIRTDKRKKLYRKHQNSTEGGHELNLTTIIPFTVDALLPSSGRASYFSKWPYLFAVLRHVCEHLPLSVFAATTIVWGCWCAPVTQARPHHCQWCYYPLTPLPCDRVAVECMTIVVAAMRQFQQQPDLVLPAKERVHAAVLIAAMSDCEK